MNKKKPDWKKLDKEEIAKFFPEYAELPEKEQQEAVQNAVYDIQFEAFKALIMALVKKADEANSAIYDQLQPIAEAIGRADAGLKEVFQDPELREQIDSIMNILKDIDSAEGGLNLEGTEGGLNLDKLPEVLKEKNIPLFLPLDRSQELFSTALLELTKQGYGLAYRRENKKKGITEAGYIFAAAYSELAKHYPELGKMGEYAKGVHNAVCGLFFLYPDSIYTLQQIYEHNGGTGNCPESERQKILRTLEKMTFRIRIESTDFIDDYGSKKKRRSPQTSKALRIYRRLLDYELIEAVENGKVINCGIRILQEPPLLSIAKLWNQFTLLPCEILQIEQKDGERRQKSETFRAIRMYLATYISKLKNPDRETPLPNKLSFNAIYEACEIDPTDRRQRKKKSAAKKIIVESLEHFKNIGFIEGYSTDAKTKSGQPAVVLFIEKKGEEQTKKQQAEQEPANPEKWQR